MQKFLIRSLFLALLLSAAGSWALPPCPGSYDRSAKKSGEYQELMVERLVLAKQVKMEYAPNLEKVNPTSANGGETIEDLTMPTAAETVAIEGVSTETVHENYYLLATREVDSARRKEALWAKVAALNEGLQEGARSKYITLKAKRLQEGMGLEGALFEGARKEGEKDGPWLTYHENGHKKPQELWTNGMKIK